MSGRNASRNGAVLAGLLIGAPAAWADEHAPVVLDIDNYLARAKNGSPYAMEMVGAAYEQGSMGAVRNFREAAQWYRKSIKASGNKFDPTFSMIELASLYLHGKGIPRDLGRAYMWYDILNTGQGQQGQWRDVLDAIIDLMTPAQINSAQEMALECQQTHYQYCGD